MLWKYGEHFIFNEETTCVHLNLRDLSDSHRMFSWSMLEFCTGKLRLFLLTSLIKLRNWNCCTWAKPSSSYLLYPWHKISFFIKYMTNLNVHTLKMSLTYFHKLLLHHSKSPLAMGLILTLLLRKCVFTGILESVKTLCQLQCLHQITSGQQGIL